jgi:5-methyltetrahydrofolate--homocysteine methyltransferase
MVEGQIVYKTTPEEFARHAEALRDIQFVGGCCGTTPDFIRALAARRSR